MKKIKLKKGFTLIEILAVIVILVIILIIAVPQILRIINNTKEEAAEGSAKGIDDSAEKFQFEKLVSEPDITDEIIFECDGTSCSTSSGDVLPINGTIPTAGKIMIDNTGEVFYLENLVIDEQTCFKKAGGDFKCTNADEENKYKAIYSIEDLVELSIEVDNGNDYKDGLINLVKDLDFNDNTSYINPTDTSFGDINKNGVVEGLKVELTTGQGFNPIGALITSERVDEILAMSHASLAALIPIINQTFDILYYYYFSSLDELIAYYSDQADLAEQIIWMYLEMGELIEAEDYYYNSFVGKFDGNGYKINNIYINKPLENNVGLFNKVEDVVISDLSITGSIVGRSYTGAIAGELRNSTLNNVHSAVSIIGVDYVGSLLGFSWEYSTVTDCSTSSSTVNGRNYVSGLIGFARYTTITNFISTGMTITGQHRTGGLIGNSLMNTIVNSSSTAVVNGVDLTGGLAGYSYYNTITNFSNTSTINGNNYIGGLAGYSILNTITNSSSTSTINGRDCLGGLTGFNGGGTISSSNANCAITSNGGSSVGGISGYVDSSKITNSYAKGSVSGSGNIGGLIGKHIGLMSNSYSNVTVTGSGNHVGGLIGMIGCTDCNHSIIGIKDCYSTGNVVSGTEAGGLVGQNAASSENSRTKYALIKNSYSLGNVRGTGGAIGGLVGTDVMNIENSYAKGNVQGTTIGNLIGNPENATYTMTNTYSVSTQVLTGTATIRGLTVIPSLLNTSPWWQSTLNLGTSFKYEDGYYPLLYKLDNNGNVTNELVEGQIKIPTP